MKKEKQAQESQKPAKKKRPSPLLTGLLILGVLTAPGLINPLTVRHYSVTSDKITHPVRIALITDLHSCSYGEQEQELISAIDAQQPDLILLGGDIFDDVLPDDNTVSFLDGISGRYPVYYVTGNHEYWAGEAVYEQKMEILSHYEIIRLAGTSDTLNINGSTLMIAGVDDPETYIIDARHGFEEQLAEVKPSGDCYSIILSHRPERVDAYAQAGFDLALCGHAHGGQWRIPGIVNGLFAPDQGFFPAHAGGRYDQDGTVMIVSRGLARESTKAPRIYNPPELVIVDLSGTAE